MLTVLFAAREERWPAYETALPDAIARTGVEARVVLQADPSEVDYIVFAPNGPVSDFRPYTKAKAVLNLWAGVEDVAGNQTLTLPLARMVEPSLTEGMVEYVVGHVLRHHLGMDTHIHGTDGVWSHEAPPLARDRTVAVLGLGALGQACAQALSAMRFQVLGWSRGPKDISGVTCRNGEDGLAETLRRADIVVLLLPLTAETEGVMNARRLALLPKGAFLINPGRGALIDDDTLLAALDAGGLGHATLDVFRTEPLPQGHAFWRHPKVTVTPHIAAETRPASASKVIAENIRRGEAGEPFLHLVNRKAGY